MNPRILLTLSVTLNVVLGLFVVKLMMSPRGEEQGVPPTLPYSETQSQADDTRHKAATRSPADSGDSPARTFNWELVESPDYREYINNLRAIGCPEETIRDIIVADVSKLYRAKKRELRGEPKEYEYWKAGNPWVGGLDAEYLSSTRELDKEKMAVLRQLGIEPDARMQMNSYMGGVTHLDAMFGFLPEDKQVGVIEIMQDMQAAMMEGADEGGGYDPEAMIQAQRDMDGAIRALLTPEEYRDYELRMSPTANAMRGSLGGWDPDEQEFLEVFELRRAFDEEYSQYGMGNETTEEQNQRREAQNELNDAIREVLGEDRYAAYERAQDWNFQQIYQAARRADLGTDEATQVYEMRQVAQEEARNLRTNEDFTEDERREALTAIRAETERSIKEVLGEEGWDQYDRAHNTYWLDNMVPREVPAE